MICVYFKNIWGERVELDNLINIKIAKDLGLKYFQCDIELPGSNYHIVNIPLIILETFEIDGFEEYILMLIDKYNIGNFLDYSIWLESEIK